MLIEQISVFIENKQGRLADVMNVLDKSGADIRAMTIGDTTDYGIMRIIVDDTEKAINALRADGCTAAVTKVIAFTIPDVSGALYKVVELLGDNGINVDYLYSAMGKTAGRADIIIRVEDNDAAIKVLTENGIQLIGSAELCRE
ncbi:MAG: hypothetical protein J1E39_05540 [Eubacterium sp.]|nr:hypothetical protein [Eubacterium sp.]